MDSNLALFSKEWFDHYTAPSNLSVVDKAKFYIARSTPYIGAATTTGAAQRFIHDCAVILEGPAKGHPNPISGRPMRNSAEAFAIELACFPHMLRDPQCIVGSTYLAVVLESFFREISGLLNSWDGSWKSPNDRIIAGQRSDRLRNPGRAPDRLSHLEIAYELAISPDNQSDPRAEHLRDLEIKIKIETSGAVTQNIGQRIAQLRNSAAHGNPIGVESEAYFYSLLVIMLTFGDPKWSPPT